MKITKETIIGHEKRFRANLINSLTGFKSGALIGTIGPDGRTNLSLFSSVLHVGANPPLIGILMRPQPEERHTYRNIKSAGCYTVNHIHEGIVRSAHQTSARYGDDLSEFDACGLTPQYSNAMAAPYVSESKIKVGIVFREEHTIAANATVFVVGEIVEIIVPDDVIGDDGYLDIEKAGTVAISGLDGYHATRRIGRLAYAKPGIEPREL